MKSVCSVVSVNISFCIAGVESICVSSPDYEFMHSVFICINTNSLCSSDFYEMLIFYVFLCFQHKEDLFLVC